MADAEKNDGANIGFNPVKLWFSCKEPNEKRIIPAFLKKVLKNTMVF